MHAQASESREQEFRVSRSKSYRFHYQRTLYLKVIHDRSLRQFPPKTLKKSRWDRWLPKWRGRVRYLVMVWRAEVLMSLSILQSVNLFEKKGRSGRIRLNKVQVKRKSCMWKSHSGFANWKRRKWWNILLQCLDIVTILCAKSMSRKLMENWDRCIRMFVVDPIIDNCSRFMTRYISH